MKAKPPIDPGIQPSVVSEKTAEVERLVRELLVHLGEDPERQGLLKTPARVRQAFEFLTRGYRQDVYEVLNEATFEEDYDEMVMVKNIDFFSLCEHHLLPFYGKAHVAYLPRGRVVGLSKIPRLVEVYARRLQLQERLTQEIAKTLDELLQPEGVAVVINGFHLCMAMRGVEKQNAMATTSAMLGAFRRNRATREEFMRLI
ncbi:MAG: GTP cyclohydrolase I FolE, partial [Candidatus Eisenbacteria bacterium]|nr:GTP cyclohydrolase I FolE [Candidatus Eisenbacteria bacterium]